MTDHRKGLRSAADKAIRSAELAYKAANPEASGLRIRADLAAFKPRDKEVRRVPIKAVALFLTDRANLAKSNAELAQEIGRDLGRRVPANMLTERLSPKQAVRVTEMLEQRGVVLDLAVCYSASKIKQALKSRRKATEATVRTTVDVSFSDVAVTVGDRAYPIQSGNGVPRIHVGKGKLNVDVLKRLLTS